MHRLKKHPNIKILMYHRLLDELPENGSDEHFTLVNEFRKQLKMIDDFGFTPITFADYQLYLEGQLELPQKPIVITFDDGYLDTFEMAVPILLELGMRAVIFVLGNRNIRRAYWDESDTTAAAPLMSDSQLRELKSLGFEIGAHSMNHLALADLPDEELEFEISASKKTIEDVLGEPVISISYPYGSIDNRVLSVTSRAGFVFGCGVYTGPPVFGDNRFDFRRLAVREHIGSTRFLLRLLTPYQYVEWAYSAVRRFRPLRIRRNLQSEL